MKNSVAMLLFTLFLSGNAHACPAGMVPNGPAAAGTTIGGCRPASHYQQAPAWSSRWGAIAQGENGKGGWVSGKKSERAAKRSAISHCEIRGGSECESTFTYRDQCVAVVNSEDGSFINTAPTEEEAAFDANQKCKKEGLLKCNLFYTDCSLPVRIQ
jgi:hypothetical protein